MRKQSVYRAGDVVLYDSRDLRSKVLHRIVRVEGGRFVLKGDNNSFVDPEQATEEQIVGSLWTTAPAVGRVSEWLRVPMHSALLVGLVTLIALGGGIGTSASVRRGSRPRTPPRLAAPAACATAVPEELKPLLLGLGVAGSSASGLAVVSFGRPLETSAETVDGVYAHQGRFEYEASVPRTAAYPDGHVSTGEPVFQRWFGVCASRSPTSSSRSVRSRLRERSP